MDGELIVIFFGMAVVTYLPRMLPLVFLSRIEIPELVLLWLKYIPVAVLAALLVPSLLAPDRELVLHLDNRFLVTALPTFIVAFKTGSLIKTIVFGILLMAIINNWF